LIGEVKRVGGVEPKVTFQTIQGQTLYCTVTEELAKELAHHLYQEVKVRGAARWNSYTFSIEEFFITALLTYQPTPPAQAFQRLRESYGHYFDEISDANTWVHQLRNE
jgi:hypothetical protein